MGKTKYLSGKAMEQALFARTEGYAANVRKIYLDALKQIIDIVKGTELEDGKPFSFSEYDYSSEVTPIFRKMYSQVYQVIRGGVEKEWLLSNENNDELVKSVFGEHSIEDNHFAKLFLRNKEAMDAFFARKTEGLNLSQKVWNYTGQYKMDLENSLDLAIGEGTPANRLATQIQKYLNEPDRFYRRFRVKVGENEDGTPKYGRVWKRRVFNRDTQTYSWINDNPKDYHPGTGVYRSSYRNAQRLARTETNIAYRTADYTRWQQLPFVSGIRICLSNNHPINDICDAVSAKSPSEPGTKGIFPKDFKWTGWHPNCRCYQVPVLAKDGDVDKMLDNIMDGEDPAEIIPQNQVKELPVEFKTWMADNDERYQRARERGTLPYFVRDNEELIHPKKLTPIEIGAQRHAARTTDQAQAIQQAWNNRRATYHYAENMLRVMGGIKDVPTDALQAAYKAGDLQTIVQEAAKLRKIGKQITALTRLDNPLQVAKDFSMADAKVVNAAVEKTLKDKVLGLPLSSQKDTLEYEINWVLNKSYATKEVAANGYRKYLAEVEKQLQIQQVNTNSQAVKAFLSAHKIKKVKELYAQIQDAIAQGDYKAAQSLIDDANVQIAAYNNKQAAKGLKSGTAIEKYNDKHRTYNSEVTGQSSFETFQDRMINDSGSSWLAGSDEARKAVHSYTDGSYDWINESYWRDKKGCHDGELISSIIDKCVTSKDMVLRRGCSVSEMGSIFGSDFEQLARNMDLSKLNALAGRRGVNEGFISTSFDMDGGFWNRVDLKIFAPKGTQALYAKPVSGFGDSYGSRWDGKTARRTFEPGRENEVIVNRGYEYRFIKAETYHGSHGSQITIYVELLDRTKRAVK